MPSFDIVSKVNEQEVDNAFQQAKKEIDQRYDFKGTETSLEKVSAPEKGLKIRSTTEQRLEAARTVLVEKMAKRGVPLRGLKYGTVEDDDGPTPGKDRLGPFPTREEAARALETVQRRNEEWDAKD